MNKRKTLQSLKQLGNDVAIAYGKERNRNNVRGYVTQNERQLLDVLSSIEKAEDILKQYEYSSKVRDRSFGQFR